MIAALTDYYYPEAVCSSGVELTDEQKIERRQKAEGNRLRRFDVGEANGGKR